jgi:hypothetical protein
VSAGAAPARLPSWRRPGTPRRRRISRGPSVTSPRRPAAGAGSQDAVSAIGTTLLTRKRSELSLALADAGAGPRRRREHPPSARGHDDDDMGRRVARASRSGNRPRRRSGSSGRRRGGVSGDGLPRQARGLADCERLRRTSAGTASSRPERVPPRLALACARMHAGEPLRPRPS